MAVVQLSGWRQSMRSTGQHAHSSHGCCSVNLASNTGYVNSNIRPAPSHGGLLAAHAKRDSKSKSPGPSTGAEGQAYEPPPPPHEVPGESQAAAPVQSEQQPAKPANTRRNRSTSAAPSDVASATQRSHAGEGLVGQAAWQQGRQHGQHGEEDKEEDVLGQSAWEQQPQVDNQAEGLPPGLAAWIQGKDRLQSAGGIPGIDDETPEGMAQAQAGSRIAHLKDNGYEKTTLRRILGWDPYHDYTRRRYVPKNLAPQNFAQAAWLENVMADAAHEEKERLQEEAQDVAFESMHHQNRTASNIYANTRRVAEIMDEFEADDYRLHAEAPFTITSWARSEILFSAEYEEFNALVKEKANDMVRKVPKEALAEQLDLVDDAIFTARPVIEQAAGIAGAGAAGAAGAPERVVTRRALQAASEETLMSQYLEGMLPGASLEDLSSAYAQEIFPGAPEKGAAVRTEDILLEGRGDDARKPAAKTASGKAEGKGAEIKATARAQSSKVAGKGRSRSASSEPTSPGGDIGAAGTKLSRTRAAASAAGPGAAIRAAEDVAGEFNAGHDEGFDAEGDEGEGGGEGEEAFGEDEFVEFDDEDPVELGKEQERRAFGDEMSHMLRGPDE